MRVSRFMGVLLGAALAACGSVKDRNDCGASADCPAGQYCAHTADGNVCWVDAVPPVVSSVTLECLSGRSGDACLRDGVLRVRATVTDDKEVLGADVVLDVGGAPVALIHASGNAWLGDVSLADVPFDHFEHAVVATVTARDGARNTAAQAPVAAVTVTRHRWRYDAGAPISAPAVMQDGTAVVGVLRTSQQVLGVRPDGTKSWDATTSAKVIAAAPSIGNEAIWVNDDRTLYAIDPTSHVTTAGVGVTLDGSTTGSLAVKGGAAPEWAFIGGASGRVGGAATTADIARSGLGDACTTGPVISADGNTVFVAVKNGASAASIRSFGFDGAFTAKWSAGVGINVTAPIAIDGGGGVWSASLDSKLIRTTPSGLSGDPVAIATLSGSGVDSPVILAGGDVVVGDAGGVLHRYSSSGERRWAVEPNLQSPVLAPLVLEGAPETLVVPTQGGRVYAIRGDGAVVWSADVDAAGLRGANLHTPATAGGPVLSTVYLAGQDGVLHAVIVDGRLDGNAPWPKAFHDPRNTNRAGAQP